tara:strand:- start:2322 stop:3275 length:954 start_codon:yes stop_codon:yes gene_type:complete
MISFIQLFPVHKKGYSYVSYDRDTDNLMPEWILKFLTAIPTTKTALKLLLAVVLTVFGWGAVNPFFKASGIPSDWIPFLLSLTIFSIAVIVTEAAYKVSIAIKMLGKYLIDTHIKKRDKLQQQEKARVTECEKVNSFRKELNLTFPHLDRASQKKLFWLYEVGDEALVWNKNPTYELNRKGLIRYIGDASGEKKIYELNPIVRDYLSEHFSKQKAALSKELDDNSRRFLRIFFDEVVPFGTSEQEKWMDSLVYESHEKMVRIKAIDKNQFTFILSSDFKDKLIRDGHFKTCYRTEVTLEPSHIHALVVITIGPKKPL